jgi:hypothetical protein
MIEKKEKRRKEKMKVCLTDMETGEVLTDYVFFIGNKMRKVDKGFVKIFVAFLDDIIEDKEIGGKAIRLLLSVMNDINWNSLEVYIYPKREARRLKVSEKTIYRWLDVLIEKEILFPTDRKYIYKIKVYSVIKGSMTEAIENELKEIAKKSQDGSITEAINEAIEDKLKEMIEE